MLSLGKAISGLLKHYGLNEAVQLHRATILWEEVVGPTIAKHSWAIEVKGHTLLVKAGTPTWRNEIAFQKDEILQAINEKIGSPLIKDIRFL